MAIEFPRHPVPSAVQVPVPDYSGQAEMWGMVARTGSKLTGDFAYLAELERRRAAITDRVAQAEAKLDVETQAELWQQDFEAASADLQQRGTPVGEMEGQLRDVGRRLHEQRAGQLKYPTSQGAFDLEVLKRMRPGVKKAQDAAIVATQTANIANLDLKLRQHAQRAATAPTEAERQGEYQQGLANITYRIRQGFSDLAGPNGAGTQITAYHIMIEDDWARAALADPARRGPTLDALQIGQFKTPYTTTPVLTVKQQQAIADEALTASNAAYRKAEDEGKARGKALYGEVDTVVTDLLTQGTPESLAEAERTLQAEPNKRLYIAEGREERWAMHLKEARQKTRTDVEKNNQVTESELNRLILTPSPEERRLTQAQLQQRVNEAGPEGTRQITANTQRMFLQLIEGRFKKTDDQSSSARALWKEHHQLTDDSLRQNVGMLVDLVPNVGFLIADAKREAIAMTHPDSKMRTMTYEDWNRKRLPEWMARAGAQVDFVIEDKYKSLPPQVRQKPVGPEMLKEIEALNRAGTLKGDEYTRALANFNTLGQLILQRRRQQQAQQDYGAAKSPVLTGAPPKTPGIK